MTTSGAAAVGVLAMVGWTGLIAGGPLVGVPSPALRAIGAPPGMVERLPAGVTVTEVGSAGIVLRGAEARELYRLGAWLVVPAGLPTCATESTS